jgi:predicted RNA binding protein YcfA (HicA-like mRNA interferase family)
MTKLPAVTGADVLRALKRAGFEVVRVKGSHHRLRHTTDHARATTVAVHAGKTVPEGTLRDIIEQAGLTVEEFVGML